MKPNKTKEALLLYAQLQQLLHCDPITGIFTWCVERHRKVKAGTRAGTVDTDPNGCRHSRIRIEDKGFKAHRIAWLYMTGRWPNHEIDHINNDATDNEFINLRECDDFGNNHNVKHRDSVGVRNNNKHNNKYWVILQWNKRGLRLGTYTTKKEAITAHKLAVRILHGKFAPQAIRDIPRDELIAEKNIVTKVAAKLRKKLGVEIDFQDLALGVAPITDTSIWDEEKPKLEWSAPTFVEIPHAYEP